MPSVSALGIVLSILGGLAELTGLALTVLGITDARRQARDLNLDRRVVEMSSSISASASTSTGTLSGGREPTPEERLAMLEQRLIALERDVEQRDAKQRERTVEEVRRGVSGARQLARDQDRALREFLHTMLTGSLERQTNGVLLFALGVILSVVANIVS